MKCLACKQAELTLASCHASWRCQECKRAFSIEAVEEIERLEGRCVELIGAASGLAGYASTCKVRNLTGWLDGLIIRINDVLDAVRDEDRAERHGNVIFRLAGKKAQEETDAATKDQ